MRPTIHRGQICSSTPCSPLSAAAWRAEALMHVPCSSPFHAPVSPAGHAREGRAADDGGGNKAARGGTLA